MANCFTVSAADVRLYTEAVASCRHPEKGRILFAARDIDKGELIAVEPRESIVARKERTGCSGTLPTPSRTHIG